MQRRRINLLVISLIALLVGICNVPVRADNGAVFAIQPATYDPSNPATRSYFIFDSQPSATIQNQFRISNTGTDVGTARFYAVDSTTGQQTGIVYDNESDPRQDVGAWITMGQQSVTLNPGETQLIPFTVTIPANPRSGQHVGGIVAENTSVAPGNPPPSGGTVDIRSLAIMAVQVNLPGPAIEQMTVAGIALGADQSNETLLLDLRNDGTMMLKPTGSVTIVNAQGQQTLISFVFNTFLPQTEISYPLSIQNLALPAAEYDVTVLLNYGASHQTSRTLHVSLFYAPTLTGINTALGSATGGTTVTLTGGLFGTLSTTQILIDGSVLPAAQVLSVTATRIIFTTPAHAAGTVTITVTVGGVTANGSVHYRYDVASPLPVTRPGGGTPGNPGALPVTRPVAPSQSSPSPLPAPRP